MEQNKQAKLATFNRIYKELDVVYHNYAKSFGLSDAAFWILYSVTERDGEFTQRDLCDDWSFAPQTINSALKDLQRRNVIVLEKACGNKKNKLIKLTDDGLALTKKVVLPLMEAECDGFDSLKQKESDLMLLLLQKYASALVDKINSVIVSE